MNNAELHDLIPLHALGALEPEEVPLLEAYLALNPEAQASYVWYLEAVTVLARALPLEEPAQDLKARMLNRVRQGGGRHNTRVPDLSPFPSAPAVPIMPNQTRPRASRIPRRKMRFVPVALAGMMLAVMAGLLVQNLQLSNNVRLLEGSQETLESLLTSSQTRMAVLNSPDGKRVLGRVFVHADGQVLIGHTMGRLSGPRTWQAWYILKGETAPRSLGITNEPRLMVHLPSNAQVIAVSEEPTGGSQTPTMIRAIARL
jgi:Anti-sigma-K factor rskA